MVMAPLLPRVLVPTLLVLFVPAQQLEAAHSPCKFCGTDAVHKAHTFDLSSLPNGSFTATGTSGTFLIASPCGCAAWGTTARGYKCTCMTQGGTRGLGDITANELTVAIGSKGFNLTVEGGDNDPPMPHGRNAVYQFICDKSAPLSQHPEPTVTEDPPGFYNVIWRHPSACTSAPIPATCPPLPPVPPLPPPPPPPPPPIPCAGSEPCLPSWKPTWHMKNSTVLYTCNNSGMHDIHHANQFGIVVYDWSNAKAIWANAHPMSSEELITKQAEMVYAADPGLPGYAPRVWAYRNTIKVSGDGVGGAKNGGAP